MLQFWRSFTRMKVDKLVSTKTIRLFALNFCKMNGNGS